MNIRDRLNLQHRTCTDCAIGNHCDDGASWTVEGFAAVCKCFIDFHGQGAS